MMLTLQEIINTLQDYWVSKGCTTVLPYNGEIGAATLHPATFFNCIDSKPCSIAYVQPVVRPADGRYGKSPNRLYQHHQYQVVIKPSPERLQDLYLGSLVCLGLSLKDHDIRFVCDDWANPSIGASGLGWEVWCDGMEISQFTYMQQIGGMECTLIPGELAYGLERLAMYLQGVHDVYDIKWSSNLSYGDLFKRSEYELTYAAFCGYDGDLLFNLFRSTEDICEKFLKQEMPLIAYDQCLKASHILNLLDAQGVLGVVERASFILKVRQMAKSCCDLYVALGNKDE